MPSTTISVFFAGKKLQIPGYQRDYAWTRENVNDLFSDIEEAIQLGGSHYLGTFILARESLANSLYEVVDGQQRLTTLTMLLDVLIKKISDSETNVFYVNSFIRDPLVGQKFSLLGENSSFFLDLLDEKSPVAGTDAQERLNSAYEYIKSLVNILNERGGQELIKAWLGSISKLEVLEFIEPDKGKAIRMFQSLNDRGVQLTKLDIVKSLLVYYSNRYLNGELDDFIVKNFGQIFKCFNTVRRLARETGYQIDHINGKDFSEDAVLRYHYFSFDSSNHDTKGGDINSPTTEEVLKDFLKETLKNLRSDQTKLKAFISDYTSDLKAFFDGLKGLVSETRNNREIFLLFVFQGVSTALYPLIIRLYMMQQLFVSTEDGSGRVLFDIIELTDFRVFKLRGTTPAVGIVKLTRSLPRLTAIEISDRLKEFCQRFMPDTLMRTRLLDQAIYPNYGLVRLLLDLDENNRELLHLLPLSLAELIELKRLGLTVEHIFPQTFEFFDVTNYGFDEDADYSSNNHFLGNLTLLEGSINTACNNRRVEEKMSATNLYSASKMTSPRHLAARHLNDCFSKDHLLKRGREITETILRRWSI